MEWTDDFACPQWAKWDNLVSVILVSELVQTRFTLWLSPPSTMVEGGNLPLQIFHSILLSKIPMKLGVLHSPLWPVQYAWEWLPNPYARWQVKDLNPAWILIDDEGNKPLSRKSNPCSTMRGVITMRGLEMRRNSFKTHCCIMGAYCSWETLNLFS